MEDSLAPKERADEFAARGNLEPSNALKMIRAILNK